MQATIIETITPANSIANGLALPSSRVSSAGSPKMLFPIMELTTRAVIDHRPIERTKATDPPGKRRTPYHAEAHAVFGLFSCCAYIRWAKPAISESPPDAA